MYSPLKALHLHNSVCSSLQYCQVGDMRIISFILDMGIWRLAQSATMLTGWQSQGLMFPHDAFSHTLPSIDPFIT